MAPPLNFLLYFLLLFAIDSSTASYEKFYAWRPEDFRGPYCQSRAWNTMGSRFYYGDIYSECCNKRLDDCYVPMEGTRCYCDQFCDRGDKSDCCPDYWRVCSGASQKPNATTMELVVTTTELPPEKLDVKDCEHGGMIYTYGKNITINCNLCWCKGNGEWNCTKNICLMDHNVSSSLQTLDLNWTLVEVDIQGNSPYVAFMNRTLDDGLNLRLGTLDPDKSVSEMQKIQFIIKKNIPHIFDGRKQWKSLLTPVLDQGWCASSWALSATTVISDRAAISDKLEKRLKYEHFLDCCFTGDLSSEKCSKGSLHLIWKYLSEYGAPENECAKVFGPSEATCRSSDQCLRFKSAPAYKLGDVNRMQHNLMVYGPLQATMRVYHDFFHYKKGVYSRPGGCNTTEPHGYHSVRIIGWGLDHSNPHRPPISYWVVANSWGTWWGEDGYFRIKRGVDECEIESYVLSAWVHPELASPRYRDHHVRGYINEHGRTGSVWGLKTSLSPSCQKSRTEHLKCRTMHKASSSPTLAYAFRIKNKNSSN